jgi:regulator of protease activity HflC (stomatin/prohibitin superfamily)
MEKAYIFPSILRTVDFSANQVTNEMQGVEVSGVLVWTIYKEKDGPLTAFKSFGEDIKKMKSVDATSKIQSMAISVLRNQIANMTIDEILRNRAKLTLAIKQECQELLSGWGVWMETCEILDVRIVSTSLF